MSAKSRSTSHKRVPLLAVAITTMLAAASSAEADPCDVRLTRDPVPVRIDYDPFAFSRPPGVWIWTWSTMAMGGAIWSCGF